MVVFAGIAVLCLGALIVRYLREKKCHSSECPQHGSGEPGPNTLKITVNYCPQLNNDSSGLPSVSTISEHVMQDMHKAFVNDKVSLFIKNARRRP